MDKIVANIQLFFSCCKLFTEYFNICSLFICILFIQKVHIPFLRINQYLPKKRYPIDIAQIKTNGNKCGRQNLTATSTPN